MLLKLLVSRRLPESVMEEAARVFEVTLPPPSRRRWTMPNASPRCAVSYVILPTLGDAFRAPAFAEVPEPRARLLANFPGGGLQSHRRRCRPAAAGLEVTNTPGAVTDATADIALTLILIDRPPGGRRRADGPRGRLDRLAPDADAGGCM